MASVRYRPTFRVTLRTDPGVDVMRRIGRAVAAAVVARTRGGRDESGHPFTPYTAAYARAKGVAPSDVDLTRSGDMLDAFGVQTATARTVTLGWSDSVLATRARYNERRGRRFLGVPPAMLADARAQVAAALRSRRR